MGDQYDLIVLDPPAFAKHRDALRNALQGYRKLNVKAFEKIKPAAFYSLSPAHKLSAKKTSAQRSLRLPQCQVAVCVFCTN